jgi:Helix-turn-helix domain
MASSLGQTLRANLEHGRGSKHGRGAALVGDTARATMLSALMGGQALTASELAARASIAKSTASGHLTKLRTPISRRGSCRRGNYATLCQTRLA